MNSQLWLTLAQSAIYYCIILIGGYYCLKYGLREVANKVTQHISDYKESFIQLTHKQESIISGLNVLTQKIAEHNTALALHDERTARTAAKLEQVDEKVNAIDAKLTDLRIEAARKK